MFTPVDLSEEGTQTYRLIASNARIIGMVTVETSQGFVTVNYHITAENAEVHEEFLAFLPQLHSLASVEPENLAMFAFAFGEPVSIPDQLSNNTRQLLYIRNTITYRPDARGSILFFDRSQEHQELAGRLKALLEH